MKKHQSIVHSKKEPKPASSSSSIDDDAGSLKRSGFLKNKNQKIEEDVYQMQQALSEDEIKRLTIDENLSEI